MTTPSGSGPATGPSRFATTHWSLVLTAGDEDDSGSCQALTELCEAYWYPLYVYIRRRVGNVHDAQDATQAFFAQLLEKRVVDSADPERGKFRAFLLTACKRFLFNEWRKAGRQKRGGGQVLSLDLDSGESRFATEAVDSSDPERLFEQQWGMTLLGRVLEQLEAEFRAKDKLSQFERLKPFLSGAARTETQDTIAADFGMTPAAVKVAVHRLRQRYRELLRAEIAQTVQPDQVDDEIRCLFRVLGGAKN